VIIAAQIVLYLLTTDGRLAARSRVSIARVSTPFGDPVGSIPRAVQAGNPTRGDVRRGA